MCAAIAQPRGFFFVTHHDGDGLAAPDQLVGTAKAMIRNGLKAVQPWDEKGFKLPGGPVYSAAGAQLWPPAIAILRRETYGNYPAAAAILKCVYEGLLVPFDTGLRIEQRYFTEIMQTKEAAAMIRSLFVSLQELNKGARRPAGVPATAWHITQPFVRKSCRPASAADAGSTTNSSQRRSGNSRECWSGSPPQTMPCWTRPATAEPGNKC